MDHDKIVWDDQEFQAKDLLFLLSSKELPKPRQQVFISYSSKDTDSLQLLISHLNAYRKAKKIDFWIDLKLRAAEQWDDQIREEMDKADVLIMLLSPDYLGSDYIIDHEVPIASGFLTQERPVKKVFWVQLKPCNYGLFPAIEKYPVYPLKRKDEAGGARQKAIMECENPDREWVDLLKFILEGRE